ncbi:hypothetical protein [Sphingomonas sp.]|jgi:hypothetical protein|uniref:hypothetical protein n=1 Tax=Sphingomonas sp. TaxID=28214 RepID=UPI002D7E5B91|nr:hypothetical protein [Sphingomonas sp.]HEU0045284.1 hypothetical protein [Sphingomonas sp.]
MTEATPPRRRRSGQSRSTAAPSLTSPQFGRRLFILMTVAGAAFLLIGVYVVQRETSSSGLGFFGMSKAETRYLFGAPTRGTDGDTEWRYLENGSASVVRFDRNGAVRTMGCAATVPDGGADCPTLFGIRIGTSEDTVWSRLGTPQALIFREDGKILHYPELGLRILLRRLQVVAVERHDPVGSLPLVGRTLRMLAP